MVCFWGPNTSKPKVKEEDEARGTFIFHSHQFSLVQTVSCSGGMAHWSSIRSPLDSCFRRFWGNRQNLKTLTWAMKKTWLFTVYGGIILPSYVGIIINHEIRIPIKQPYNGKWEVFFLGSHDFSWFVGNMKCHEWIPKHHDIFEGSYMFQTTSF